MLSLFCCRVDTTYKKADKIIQMYCKQYDIDDTYLVFLSNESNHAFKCSFYPITIGIILFFGKQKIQSVLPSISASFIAMHTSGNYKKYRVSYLWYSTNNMSHVKHILVSYKLGTDLVYAKWKHILLWWSNHVHYLLSIWIKSLLKSNIHVSYICNT